MTFLFIVGSYLLLKQSQLWYMPDLEGLKVGKCCSAITFLALLPSSDSAECNMPRTGCNAHSNACSFTSSSPNSFLPHLPHSLAPQLSKIRKVELKLSRAKSFPTISSPYSCCGEQDFQQGQPQCTEWENSH